jgi:Ca2+-binding RTX toxin-like protein
MCRRRLLFTVLLLVAALLAALPARPGEATTFPAGWAVPQAGTDLNWAYRVALDGTGNVYVGGTFYGQVEFDPGPGIDIRTAYGHSDAFVAKYDPNGDLLWVGTFSGNGYEAVADIAVDGDGAVYVTGTFTGTVDFDPDFGDVVAATSAGQDDGYVAKLDTTGDLGWVKTFGGPENDSPSDIELEPFVQGSVLRWRTWVTGGFYGTADFDPGPGVYPLISHGSQDAFVLRLNPDGYFIWAVQAGGTGYDGARGLAVDGTRGYVTGQFQGTADFDPGMGDARLTAAGTSDDAFVWMLNGNGAYGWAGRIGGDSYDAGSRIAADHAGSLFVLGTFQGTMDVGLAGGWYSRLTSEGVDDLFLVKMGVDGTPEWARDMGGSGMDTPYDLTTGAGGGIYLAGSFEDTANFDPFPGGFEFTSNGQLDAFAVRLDSRGMPTHGAAIGGNGIDAACGMAVDPGGYVHLVGSFADTVDFDPGPGVKALTSQGHSDGFVAKMDLTGPTVVLTTPAHNGSYPVEHPLTAAYSCSDGASGLVSCSGEVDGVAAVPDGGTIDTTTGGMFSFSVTATDVAGNSTTVIHIYRVGDACNGKTPDVFGTQGNDVLKGTAGADVIAGYGGDDVILGYDGNDVICGGEGDDDIRGGPGADELYGEDGNDRLRGASGDDHLYGGAGSDRLLPETGNDTLDGGPGSDIADYLAASGPVEVNLETGTATYTPAGEGPFTDTLVLVEKVDGTPYADRLVGDWRRNVLRGKHGADEIHGGDGPDDLIGGLGSDGIHGNEGDDLIKGQGDDDWMWGDNGADRLVGGSGDDHLFGGPGDDTLIGGLKIHFGTYTNEIDGEAGTDTCRWWFDGPANCEP